MDETWNERPAADPSEETTPRRQMSPLRLRLDEESRTASLVLNADLGVYAVAVGSAQSLANGGFSFESGFINPGPSAYSRETEVTADGKIAYTQQLDGALTYRSFRVPDLYTAPRK